MERQGDEVYCSFCSSYVKKEDYSWSWKHDCIDNKFLFDVAKLTNDLTKEEVLQMVSDAESKYGTVILKKVFILLFVTPSYQDFLIDFFPNVRRALDVYWSTGTKNRTYLVQNPRDNRWYYTSLSSLGCGLPWGRVCVLTPQVSSDHYNLCRKNFMSRPNVDNPPLLWKLHTWLCEDKIKVEEEAFILQWRPIWISNIEMIFHLEGYEDFEEVYLLSEIFNFL